MPPQKTQTCPICDRIRMQQWEHTMSNHAAFYPANPIVPGHMVIAPFTHVDPTTEFMPSFYGQIASYAAVVARVFKFRTYNLVTSFGADAGMSVRHICIHMIPRKKGDGIRMPWEFAEEIAAEIGATDGAESS